MTLCFVHHDKHAMGSERRKEAFLLWGEGIHAQKLPDACSESDYQLTFTTICKINLSILMLSVLFLLVLLFY